MFWTSGELRAVVNRKHHGVGPWPSRLRALAVPPCASTVCLMARYAPFFEPASSILSPKNNIGSGLVFGGQVKC